jgi:hypothetical protein
MSVAAMSDNLQLATSMIWRARARFEATTHERLAEHDLASRHILSLSDSCL